mgnify:CR=1 FL=1
MELDWPQTLALLCLGLTLFLWGREYDRRPIDFAHPRLIPPLPVMAFGILLSMLMIAHLITLATGRPLTGNTGVPAEMTGPLSRFSGGHGPTPGHPLAVQLLVIIGLIGAAFVITQYHTSIMFAPNCVGTANATTAGVFEYELGWWER